jgi:phenylacetate-CoA ligase
MIWNQNKECMSREEMSELQGKRLHKLVSYVYHNCAFYRNKMQELGLLPDDITTIEDITKLPFTTKQDLRDNYPTGMFSASPDEFVRIHASTGTTGKPTIVGYTRRDLSVWSETMTRGLSAWGVTKHDLVSNSYGYGLFTGGLGMHYGVENLGAAIIPTGTGNSDKHIRLLLDLGVTVITCTPSYALYLSDKMDKLGVDRKNIKLRIGGFGGEPWTENMRKEIESKLGIKAYNVYGLSEIIGPGVSFECECQNGSHIAEDHYYPEIIDPVTTRSLGLGEQGELVLTTLTKEGMPLLRYRTKDLTSLMPGTCPCGRTEVRMNRILGRSDDMLIIRGINVFPSQVESVILSMREFEPYYLMVVDRKNNLDTLEIQVEVREGFYSDELSEMNALSKKLASQIKSVLSISAKITLVEPGSIERAQGKSQHVLDNRVIK